MLDDYTSSLAFVARELLLVARDVRTLRGRRLTTPLSPRPRPPGLDREAVLPLRPLPRPGWLGMNLGGEVASERERLVAPVWLWRCRLSLAAALRVGVSSRLGARLSCSSRHSFWSLARLCSNCDASVWVGSRGPPSACSSLCSVARPARGHSLVGRVRVVKGFNLALDSPPLFLSSLARLLLMVISGRATLAYSLHSLWGPRALFVDSFGPRPARSAERGTLLVCRIVIRHLIRSNSMVASGAFFQ